MDNVVNLDSISFDWFILFLRVAFIALVYLFLYQIARVMISELVLLGTVSSPATADATPGYAAALEILEPADSPMIIGESIPLDHYTTIGRRPSNSLQIEDSFVSGAHAELVFDEGSWWLIDLGSTNGTFINGRPVRQRTRVQAEDIVQFGRTKFRAIV
jgi:hypothetical protein